MPLDDPRFVPYEAIESLRPHPPAGLRLSGLWVAGDLAGLEGRVVAVVGCRAASDGGRRRAHDLARALAAAGACVLSGLALGIDGAAHAGALERGGRTIGILGGGHRAFFPTRNRALALAILAGQGAVVSPFAPDEPARPFQFLQRNALVAGFADAVVVVEAAARSGALNTAGWAASRGIPVFAFPGDPDRAKAAGCNALIRDGATLARDAAAVLADLGWAAPVAASGSNSRSNATTRVPTDSTDPAADSSHQSKGSPIPLWPRDTLERAALVALSAGPRSLDDLLETLEGESGGAAPGAALAALVRLELAGEVERRDGGYALRT